MAFLDHNGESEFPMNKNQVFDAMCAAIPTIKGLKVENADKLQGRIMVKAGVSLYSWGENIPIQLLEISDNKTKVQITSSPKTGVMFGGAFDMGKNRKNIENILAATSRLLQQSFKENQISNSNSQTSQFQPTQNFQTMSTGTQPTGQQKKKLSTGKKILIGIGIVFIIGFIANLGSDSKTAQTATTTSTSVDKKSSTDNTTTAKSDNSKNWQYSEDIDQMDNTKRTIASLTADNTINFDFPYKESEFTLNIRKWKGSTDIYLHCSSCQFIAGVMGEKTYRVKFDDEPPFKVTANHTTSGSSDIVFLGSEKKLIAKLKTATKVLIEPEFFDVGLKPITFTVKGLEWQ